MNDPRSDAAISRDVAQDAGQLLLQIRQDFIAEHGPIGDKETANMLRDRADAASNDLILDFLSSARPQDAVLSEEAKDDPSRLDSERVWIVDPLDGTWEYGQDRADFAVHVALWAAGEL
ncbi:MAG: 3'(2'),5'-bisphosphate nucleotidase CysQ, partial [Actinobacteria bacterium]|nr:3'(2'),5'-bisphosphate nucleotidase CysQ [Actinomycetota bacterium]